MTIMYRQGTFFHALARPGIGQQDIGSDVSHLGTLAWIHDGR